MTASSCKPKFKGMHVMPSGSNQVISRLILHQLNRESRTGPEWQVEPAIVVVKKNFLILQVFNCDLFVAEFWTKFGVIGKRGWSGLFRAKKRQNIIGKIGQILICLEILFKQGRFSIHQWPCENWSLISPDSSNLIIWLVAHQLGTSNLPESLCMWPPQLRCS